MRNYNGIKTIENPCNGGKSTVCVSTFYVLCCWDGCKCKMQMQLTVTSSFTSAWSGVSFYSMECAIWENCVYLQFAQKPAIFYYFTFISFIYGVWIKTVQWFTDWSHSMHFVYVQMNIIFIFKFFNRKLQSSIWPRQIANQLITFSIIFFILKVPNETPKNNMLCECFTNEHYASTER